jgi:hemerythrin
MTQHSLPSESKYMRLLWNANIHCHVQKHHNIANKLKSELLTAEKMFMLVFRFCNLLVKSSVKIHKINMDLIYVGEFSGCHGDRRFIVV